MHKISKTMALMSLLVPVGASALGVGDIRLHSALNQTLSAEIPLVLSGSDTLADVKVTLASSDAFAKAGVERQFFLSKLQFIPTVGPNGSYVIKVTSKEVMREPFLDFLVEVNWPQGRIMREYTVLLDPPATLPETTTVETRAPAIQPGYGYDRERTAANSQDYPPPPRRSASRPVAARPNPLPPPSESQLTDTAYGPVQRGETLSSISRLIEHDPSLTQEQMMLGLYRANPQAFAGGRINGLKAGAVLRIPTTGFIAQLNPQQARAEFAHQQQGWSAGIALPTPPAATGDAAAPQAQLKLMSPNDARSKGRNTVSGSEAEGGRGRGDLALEVAETVKQETEDLRQQLQQLRQELANMQRLISLKDERIATLETQKPVSPQVPTSPKPTPQTEAPAVTPPLVAKPQTPPSGVTPPVTPPPVVPMTPPPQAPVAKPPVATVPPAPKPTPAPKPVTPAAPAEAGWSIDPIYLAAGGGALGIAGITAWLIIRRRNAMIAETESILLAAERESQQRQYTGSKLTESPTALPEPVSATKSSFLSEFTPSDFDALGAETDEVDPVSEADVYLAYGRYKQAEELIRHAIAQHPNNDECKLKLLEIYYATENRGAFEGYAHELKNQGKSGQEDFWTKVEEMGRELLGAAHPLFQADPASARPAAAPAAAKNSGTVAKALGSLDLSDDLIDDLKRFEIEFLDSGASASGRDAEEDDDFLTFSSVPETPVNETRNYAPPIAESPAKNTRSSSAPSDVESFLSAAASESDADEFLELDAETSPAEEAYFGPDTGAKPLAEDYRALDAFTAAPPKEEKTAPETEERSAFASLDFDLDFLNADATPVPEEDREKIGELENLIPFDLGKPATESKPAPEAQVGEKTIDDILRELTSQIEREEAAAAPAPAKEERNTLGSIDFNFDLDLLQSATEARDEHEEEEQPELAMAEDKDDLFADLTDMDQFETKLDLAKAYADMEDEESAREILREVVAKGSEKQRLEATTLLEKFGFDDFPQPRSQQL